MRVSGVVGKGPGVFGPKDLFHARGSGAMEAAKSRAVPCSSGRRIRPAHTASAIPRCQAFSRPWTIKASAAGSTVCSAVRSRMDSYLTQAKERMRSPRAAAANKARRAVPRSYGSSYRSGRTRSMGMPSSGSCSSTRVLDPLDHSTTTLLVVCSMLRTAYGGWETPTRRSPIASAAAFVI